MDMSVMDIILIQSSLNRSVPNLEIPPDEKSDRQAEHIRAFPRKKSFRVHPFVPKSSKMMVSSALIHQPL
jgi:hypothetical protein